MPNSNILLRRAVILFGVIWALVVFFFVWTILSIDPRDVSISPSALFNASGSSVAQQVIAFLIFAFGVWVIPVSIAWQLSTKIQRSPILTTGFVALFALVVYLLFKPVSLETANDGPGELDSAFIKAPAPVVSQTDNEPEHWECKNTLEVACSDNDCVASNDHNFTPMSVDLYLSGKVSVCAYTGCWKGMAQVIKSGGFVVFIADNLPFSTNSDPRAAANIAIALDQADQVATIKVAAFSQPLLCRRNNQL